MKKYKIISTTEVREEPTIEEPNLKNTQLIGQVSIYLENKRAYNKHLASLRTYPLATPVDKSRIGEVVEIDLEAPCDHGMKLFCKCGPLVSSHGCDHLKATIVKDNEICEIMLDLNEISKNQPKVLTNQHLQEVESSWIKIEEGCMMPERGDEVLVYGICKWQISTTKKGYSIGLVMWSTEKYSPCKDLYSINYTNITHWKAINSPKI